MIYKTKQLTVQVKPVADEKLVTNNFEVTDVFGKKTIVSQNDLIRYYERDHENKLANADFNRDLVRQALDLARLEEFSQDDIIDLLEKALKH